MSNDEIWLQIKPHAEAIARIFQVDLSRFTFECEFISREKNVEMDEISKWCHTYKNQ